MMPKIKINKKENKVLIFVSPKLYSLKAVYGASYVFLDRAYIYLEGDPEKEIRVHLKGKKKLTKKEMESLTGEFFNELLNCSLRYQISKDNRKIREYIVGTALIGASGDNIDKLVESEKKDWEKDPLGIAVPWEERYSKKTVKKKNGKK